MALRRDKAVSQGLATLRRAWLTPARQRALLFNIKAEYAWPEWWEKTNAPATPDSNELIYTASKSEPLQP